MKLGKAQSALLLVTVLFVTFTLAFFLGRRSVHAQITTERAAEEIVQERPDEAQNGEDLSSGIPDSAPDAAAEKAGPQGRVDINRASQAELEALPGIGPVLAQRIVEWRERSGPFVSAEQIMDVEGIGEGKYAEIRDQIYVEDGQ